MSHVPHVYGATCSWHGTIDQAISVVGRDVSLPGCPHCGAPLMMMSQADWDEAVAAHATTTNDPAYPRFVAWCSTRGRCSNLAHGGYEAVRAEFDKLPCEPASP